MPNQPSARKIGGYIMWVTFAAGCVTSTLFMTACAPNFLALEFLREIAGVEITYLQWMLASAPFALPLLLLPILTYVFIRRKPRVAMKFPAWAAEELQKMGPFPVESAFFLLWFCLP
jgi:L-tartrate/succinate antiporter